MLEAVFKREFGEDTGINTDQLDDPALEALLGDLLGRKTFLRLPQEIHPFSVRIQDTPLGSFLDSYARERGIELLGELAHLNLTGQSMYGCILRSFFESIGYPLDDRGHFARWRPSYTLDPDMLKRWNTPMYQVFPSRSVWVLGIDAVWSYRKGACFFGQIAERHKWKSGKTAELQRAVKRNNPDWRVGFVPRDWEAPGLDQVGRTALASMQLVQSAVRPGDLIFPTARKSILSNHIRAYGWVPLAFVCLVDPFSRWEWDMLDTMKILTIQQLLASDPAKLSDMFGERAWLEFKELLDRFAIHLPMPNEEITRLLGN